MPYVGKRAAFYLLIDPKGLLTNVPRRIAAMSEQGLPSSLKGAPLPLSRTSIRAPHPF